MKRVKRCIAVILSLAIIMTGIYWCENPAEEVQAATETEVNSEMLELKFQRGITDDTINKIRVVASVDSPNYSAVGFGIDKGDGNGEQLFTINTKTHPLPQRIKSSVTGLEYSFSPKVVDTSSEYFLTAKWTATENAKYTVRAWVKTFDGDMVFGQSRCITLNDLSTTEYLNMSFELNEGCELPKSTEDETKYADINVTYNGASTQAEVISVKVDENGGQTVHVNVKNVNRTALPSVTEFVFGEYGSSTFRNLYTSYTETTVDEVTTDTADTSWYNTTDDEFVIATSADLYGLAKIVNGTETGITADSFSSKTVYVVSDIEANKGQATEDAWSTVKDADGTTIEDGSGTDYQWTPIGTTTNGFAGIFEGNLHTIKGIYANNGTEILGLFGVTEKGSSIQNLRLENSYFYNENNGSENERGTGSIVGLSAGNLVNVYSNAYVSACNFSGGLVGNISVESADDTISITQCWFDGNFYTVGSAYQNGGIVGAIRGGKVVMTDCLNTGSINCNQKTFKGGLCGRVRTDIGPINLTMKNCLNYGQITNYVSVTTDNATGYKKAYTGSIVGNIAKGDYGQNVDVTIESVYATEACYAQYEHFNGIGYDQNLVVNSDVINKVDSITVDTFVSGGFDTLVWGLEDDGTPKLNMTMPVAK